MNDKVLTNKIKSELMKSGFPSELKCRKIIRDHKFIISLNRIFLDSDNNEHEIDLVAFKQGIICILGEKKASNISGVVTTYLILECKKNEGNHWIFFDERMGSPQLNIVSNLNRKEQFDIEWMRNKSLDSHHYRKFQSTSCYSMAFRDDKKNQIFEAINQINSAYKHQTSSLLQNISNLKSGFQVNIYYPLIVFDGRLFIANIEKNQLNVNEVENLLYLSYPPQQLKLPHTFDVVKIDFLDQYLEYLENDHNLICQCVNSIIERK
jgi:hypothetical protein